MWSHVTASCCCMLYLLFLCSLLPQKQELPGLILRLSDRVRDQYSSWGTEFEINSLIEGMSLRPILRTLYQIPTDNWGWPLLASIYFYLHFYTLTSLAFENGGRNRVGHMRLVVPWYTYVCTWRRIQYSTTISIDMKQIRVQVDVIHLAVAEGRSLCKIFN